MTVLFRSSDHARDPVAGVPVAFYQPGGALADMAITGEDGTATAMLSPGGAVVAFETATVAGAPRLDAWAVLGVEPGDLLPLGGRDGRRQSVGQMQIQFPPIDGVSIYLIHTACGSFSGFSTTVTIRRFADCTPRSLIVVADLYGDRRSIAVEPVTFVDGGTLVVTDGWSPVETRSVEVTGLPAGTPQVRGAFRRGRLGSDSFDLELPADAATIDGAQAELALQRASGVDGTSLVLDVGTAEAGDGDKRAVAWLPGAGTDVSLPASELLLPSMGYVLVDVVARELTWPVAGAGSWDATLVEIDWRQPFGSEEPAGHWYIALAPDSTSAVIPPVPEQFSAWLPADPWEVATAGALFDSDQIDGWDDARALGCDPLFRPFLDAQPVPSLTRFAFSDHASGGSDPGR